MSSLHSSLSALSNPPTPRPPATEAARLYKYIKQTLAYLKGTKPDGMEIALALQLPGSAINVHRIGTATEDTLTIEVYDKASYTLLVVPVQQCTLAFHVYTPSTEVERIPPFMGFIDTESPHWLQTLKTVKATP